MSTKNTKKHLHLSLDDRIEIQECLSHGMTFKAIARRISKDPTTVSKEVKKHISISPTKVRRTDKDGKPVVAVCPKLLKPPFVCNACPKVHSVCGFDRHIYRAKTAHSEYEKLLSEVRVDIMFNKQEFFDMDAIISDGIKNGQHLYQILQINGLSTSKTTVYRHLKKGYLSVITFISSVANPANLSFSRFQFSLSTELTTVAFSCILYKFCSNPAFCVLSFLPFFTPCSSLRFLHFTLF